MTLVLIYPILLEAHGTEFSGLGTWDQKNDASFAITGE